MTLSILSIFDFNDCIVLKMKSLCKVFALVGVAPPPRMPPLHSLSPWERAGVRAPPLPPPATRKTRVPRLSRRRRAPQPGRHQQSRHPPGLHAYAAHCRGAGVGHALVHRHAERNVWLKLLL